MARKKAEPEKQEALFDVPESPVEKPEEPVAVKPDSKKCIRTRTKSGGYREDF